MSSTIILAGSAFLLAASAAGVQVDQSDCAVARITAQGERLAMPAAQAQSTSDGRSASAQAASQGAGGVGSAVSASSSSSSSGKGQTSARSVATSVDPQGRTITTIHENGRCTITIDERTVSGGTR